MVPGGWHNSAHEDCPRRQPARLLRPRAACRPGSGGMSPRGRGAGPAAVRGQLPAAVPGRGQGARRRGGRAGGGGRRRHGPPGCQRARRVGCRVRRDSAGHHSERDRKRHGTRARPAAARHPGGRRTGAGGAGVGRAPDRRGPGELGRPDALVCRRGLRRLRRRGQRARQRLAPAARPGPVQPGHAARTGHLPRHRVHRDGRRRALAAGGHADLGGQRAIRSAAA